MDDVTKAIEGLVESYGQDLFRLCLMRLGDPHLAQDAVQETFLKASQAYPRFRHECSEKTWLITIAFRTCSNMLRSSHFRHENRYTTPDKLPLSAPEERNAWGDVTRAVLKLDPSTCMAVVLHYYCGMKAREIARVQGVPTATVLSRLKRGREKLRRMLEKGGEDHDEG